MKIHAAAHTGAVTLLSVLFILLFVAALLLILPVTADISVTLSARGGFGRAKITVLGVPKRLRLRFHGLQPPLMQVFLLTNSGLQLAVVDLAAIQEQEIVQMKPVLRQMRLSHFKLTFAVGVENSAAVTALLSGTLCSALDMFLFCAYGRSVRVAAVPVYGKNLIRIKLEGMVSLQPVKLLLEIMKGKREKRIVSSH